MKKSAAMYVIAFLFISFNLHLTEACSGYNVAISSIGDQPNDQFVWTYGEDVTLLVDFRCTAGLNNSNSYGFTWLRPKEKFYYYNYFTYVQYGGYDTSYAYDYNYYSYISYTFSSAAYRFMVNITIGSKPANGSRLVIDFYGSPIIAEQRVIIRNCELGSELTPLLESNNNRSFSYKETVKVTCQSGAMQLTDLQYNSSFADDVVYSLATCGKNIRWNITKCPPNCAASDLNLAELTFSNPNRSSPNSKKGTTFELVCKEGLMTSESADTYVTSYVVVTCQDQDKWQADNVSCWKGQYVDAFAETSSSVKVVANEEVLILCKKSSRETSLEYKGNVIKSQKSAKIYVTPTSSDHRQQVICRRTNNNAAEEYKELTLDVLFSPELSNPNHTYSLSVGKEDHVVVSFRSNPPVSRSNVKVQRNGTELTNFYLNVAQLDHHVVLDFIQLEEKDFGDYVITVTSYQPKNSTLEIRLKIKPTAETSNYNSSTAGIYAAVIVLSTLLLIFLLVTISLTIAWKFGFKFPKITAARSTPKSKRCEGGVDVQAREKDGDEQRRYDCLSNPSTVAAEQRYVEQENEYMNPAMPSNRTISRLPPPRPVQSTTGIRGMKYVKNEEEIEANYEDI